MPVKITIMYKHVLVEDREIRFLIHIPVYEVENHICFFLPDQYKKSTATSYKKTQAEKYFPEVKINMKKLSILLELRVI